MKKITFLIYTVAVLGLQLAVDAQQKPKKWTVSDDGKAARISFNGTTCYVEVDDAVAPKTALVKVQGTDEKRKKVRQEFNISRRSGGGSLGIGQATWTEVRPDNTEGDPELEGTDLFDQQCRGHLSLLPEHMRAFFRTF